MTPKRRRLWLLLGSLGTLGVAAALVLTALNDNLVFFYSPTQVAEKSIGPDRRFRLGGLVEEGSVQKDGQIVRFTVTDTHKTVKEVDVVLGSEMIHRHTGHVGRICFVVRRPGSCRLVLVVRCGGRL